MTDDSMRQFATLLGEFEAFNERYATPEGWMIATSAGWPVDLLDALNLPDEDLARSSLMARTVEWAGYSYPATFTTAIARIDASGPSPRAVPPFTRLFMTLSQDHEVHIPAVIAGGGEVDDRLASLLHMRPLDWWKTKALVDLRFAALVDVEDQSDGQPAAVRQAAAMHLMQAAMRPAETSQQRRNNKLTPSLLQQVADTYRAALAEGNAPTEAVRARFQLTRPNASKWVARARRDGFLGPALGPVAGELTDE